MEKADKAEQIPSIVSCFKSGKPGKYPGGVKY
jgi:hypothetical protein